MKPTILWAIAAWVLTPQTAPAQLPDSPVPAISKAIRMIRDQDQDLAAMKKDLAPAVEQKKANYGRLHELAAAKDMPMPERVEKATAAIDEILGGIDKMLARREHIAKAYRKQIETIEGTRRMVVDYSGSGDEGASWQQANEHVLDIIAFLLESGQISESMMPMFEDLYAARAAWSPESGGEMAEHLADAAERSMEMLDAMRRQIYQRYDRDMTLLNRMQLERVHLSMRRDLYVARGELFTIDEIMREQIDATPLTDWSAVDGAIPEPWLDEPLLPASSAGPIDRQQVRQQIRARAKGVERRLGKAAGSGTR